MAKKKKIADKIVTAELNSLLWQLFESENDAKRLAFAAKIIAVYGLIPDTPFCRCKWIKAGLR